MKQLATKGDVKSARILAKEVVRSNKQKDRLSVSKARLGSIGNQLMQQMGMLPSPRVLLDYRHLPTNSYDQSHRLITEVDGDHEAVELVDQASTNKSDNARDEYGDDEGACTRRVLIRKTDSFIPRPSRRE